MIGLGTDLKVYQNIVRIHFFDFFLSVVKKLCTMGRGGLLDHGLSQTTQKHLLSQKDSLLSGEETAGALAGIIFKKRRGGGVYVSMG